MSAQTTTNVCVPAAIAADPLLVEAYRAAAEQNVLRALNPQVFFGYFSVCADGLHDDTAGIQALLDAGTSAVYLPPPPKHYLISRTLLIHSGQTLRLDPFTVIRLAPRSDTVMITNDDHDQGNESIALVGGIWDMDNRQQAPNPFPAMGQAALTTPYDPARFIGVLLRFNRMRNLTIDGYSRVEERQACDDIHIEPEVVVDGLTLRDVRVVNRTPGPIVLLHNRGTIRNLTLDGISQVAEGTPACGRLVQNSGTIEALHGTDEEMP